MNNARNMSVPPKDPENLTVNQVRQGETGQGLRYVLMVSLAAALAGLIAVWIYMS